MLVAHQARTHRFELEAPLVFRLASLQAGTLIRWERKAANYLAFTQFACALIAFRGVGIT